MPARTVRGAPLDAVRIPEDRKSTRLNSSHANISYAVFCLKKKPYFHLRSCAGHSLPFPPPAAEATTDAVVQDTRRSGFALLLASELLSGLPPLYLLLLVLP